MDDMWMQQELRQLDTWVAIKHHEPSLATIFTTVNTWLTMMTDSYTLFFIPQLEQLRTGSQLTWLAIGRDSTSNGYGWSVLARNRHANPHWPWWNVMECNHHESYHHTNVNHYYINNMTLYIYIIICNHDYPPQSTLIVLPTAHHGPLGFCQARQRHAARSRKWPGSSSFRHITRYSSASSSRPRCWNPLLWRATSAVFLHEVTPNHPAAIILITNQLSNVGSISS